MALEAGRQVSQLPDEPSISVVTLAELHLGVLRAKDSIKQARRLRTLARIERELEPIPIDADIARVFASIVAEARQRGYRPHTMDTWIAATAVRHGLVLFTQDADVDKIPQVEVRRV